MNISINIGINQGTININSVEFTGNSSESVNDDRYAEDVVVQEQEEKEEEKENTVDFGVEKDVIVHQQEVEEIAQQILEEIKEIYTPKKKDSVFLSGIYVELYSEYRESNYYMNKSERMYHCGSFLAYEVNKKGEKKLIKANTCHVRLCPMCMWKDVQKSH